MREIRRFQARSAARGARFQQRGSPRATQPPRLGRGGENERARVEVERPMKPANDTKAATVSRLRCQQRGTCAAAAHAVHARGKLQGELPGHCATGVRMRCRQSLGRGGGRRTDQVMQKPQSTGSARAAQRAVNEVDAHVTTRRRRRTSSCAPARTRCPWPLHTQRWRTVMCRRAGEVVACREMARVRCACGLRLRACSR